MQLALVDALTSDERQALALLRGDGLLRWELEDAAGWSAARTQRVLDDLASRGSSSACHASDPRAKTGGPSRERAGG